MRIAYLAQPYPPMISGASIAAGQLAEEMANHGHEVLVVAASDREYAYTQTMGNLTVVRLRSINNPLRIGQRVLLAPRSKVLKALHDFQPDVIHIHEPLQMGWIGLEYARQAHIPITLTTHQLPWFIASYFPDHALIRKIVEGTLWPYAAWLMKKYSAIIAPTRTISRVIHAKAGIRTRTIPFGIDLETFHPRPCLQEESAIRARFKLPANVPIILHTGRLDTDKLANRVLLAAATVMHQSDAQMVVVGDGKQKGQLTRLCQTIGIEERVHFTGYISRKETLAAIYRTASLFVTASQIETQGIVLLEAAACGLPIAAVNATCIPEIVHHGENGFLSEPGDIAAMGRSIDWILRNPENARGMGNKSRIIAEQFNTEACFARHEKLYKQLMRQKCRTAIGIKKRAKRAIASIRFNRQTG